MTRRLLLAALACCALGCGATEPPSARVVAPITAAGAPDGAMGCDAGDEAFVKRVLPFVLGRRPQSIREVEVLVAAVQQVGRADLVRALTRADEYAPRWQDFLEDHLFVNRAGARTNEACYGVGLRDGYDGTLATEVRDRAPEAFDGMTPWTMFDLIRSALVLDDLSPVLRAQLFAQAATVLVPPGDPYEELGTRETFADVFQRSYLNRRLECLGCHNSQFSVTGHDDPAKDRTWEVPGRYEAALFEHDSGRPRGDLACMFRVVGVTSLVEIPTEYTPIVEFGEGIQPWGIAPACGVFVPEDEITADGLCTDSGWFVQDQGRSGTIWSIERVLRVGFALLRGKGIEQAPDAIPGGPEAAATLVALTLSERVWAEATGSKLTIANYFPRTRSQRDVLSHLAADLTRSKWSLRELLVSVATHPYFNQGAPAECGDLAGPYHLPPLFDPWVIDEEVEEERDNSVGDVLHRHPARVLLSMVVHAMQWTPYAEFFTAPADSEEGFQLQGEAEFQRDIGIFLKDTETGFGGIDFQGTLTWENAFGACRDPNLFTEEDGFDADASDDFVTRILAAATPEHTLEDAIVALKDRLLTEPLIVDEAERTLLEALVEQPLQTPLVTASTPQAALRRVCAALLASPQFLLAGDVGVDRIGERPRIEVPGTDLDSLTARVASWLAR